MVAAPTLAKPDWIRVRLSHSETFRAVKQVLREQGLHTVCDEASCPNIGECFSKGTATFMVLGDLCTRRCPFCDVAHGRPAPPDPQEPLNLAHTVARLRLAYVVITSVDRDDLRDGGAGHFADPSIMGMGPVPASQLCLKKAGWSAKDLDLMEINEACAVNQEMGWDTSKINVNGGAIAIGHPIGASGARILVTLTHEMIRRDAKRGLACAQAIHLRSARG